MSKVRDAIASKLRDDLKSMTFWKPNQELLIEDKEGKKAQNALEDRIRTANGHFDAVATQLTLNERVDGFIRSGDAQKNSNLVHVIVQANYPERSKRPLEGEESKSPKRSRGTNGGSDHSDGSDPSQKAIDSLRSILSVQDHSDLDNKVPSYLRNADDFGLFHNVLFGSLGAYKDTEHPFISAEMWDGAWKKHPQLREVLVTCKEKWSFQKLREQAVLHRTVLKSPPIEKWLKVDQGKAITKAWTHTYCGDSHAMLLKDIRKMNNDRKSKPHGEDIDIDIYANCLPIIQSSGTGKSRMVKELAGLIFTIPFCIRQEGNENDQIPYPPADQNVVSFLLAEKLTLYEDVLLLYFTFFEHLFDCVEMVIRNELQQHLSDRVEEVKSQEPGAHQSTNELRVARAWHTYLTAEKRANLYTSVIGKIDNSIIKASDEDIEHQIEQTLAKGKTLTELLQDLTCPLTPVADDCKEQHPLNLVLYFDEAHTLAGPPFVESSGGRKRSRYDALLAALDRMRDLPLFAITLSTNSSLRDLAASKRMQPSGRLNALTYDTLQAPYTELPFDCLPDGEPIITAGQCTLKDTCDVSFLSRFGRPLWMTTYKYGTPGVRRNLVDFAMAKLTGMQAFSERNADNRARLAILATRLLLDINITRQTALEMSLEMVRSNMRIAYSVPTHREHLWSGYPSEPILAEAAARAMARFTYPVVETLEAFVKDGLIEKGELVMRLLLIEAFDAAARENSSGPPQFNKPVSLFAFLEALFGTQKLEQIKKMVPDNMRSNSKTFEDAFKDAQVHFTHFARNGNMSVSNSKRTWAALARGMAIACAPNQDVIDCIIPVLLDGKEKLCEKAVTGLLIQCKNKQRESLVTIDEAAINKQKGFFLQDDNDDRPYIGLLMQLGFQNDEPKVKSDAPRRNPPRNAESDARHPRYFINIRGCSPTEYAVITPATANFYAALLRNLTLFNEHARQDAGNIKALWRLKPEWVEEECYEWVADNPNQDGGVRVV
ncbi:hypothetical protein WOLCODRAFT_136576 [Wolfiporia cocos MD-104 SS10]|uniref:Uncharacterized protein n=1 Tax=Wolfiporia cocos (strain MD-104) TaxID=742152 RepID=A0A2H3JEH1_WOLCO|nr:hypothetical protein WOLCODRAFT_136576 [Wolfiporia cocos MD-104 SS10]